MRLGEYINYDATGLASLVRAGDVTPLELTQLARNAHDDVNPRINAVIEFYGDADGITGADGGLFHGVPFFRKDAGATEAGRLQELGCRLYKGRRPDVESYFFRRARAAGLQTLGRTTTPEIFGGSGVSESILTGITGNPWNLERSAGGSSSGAAAAVASGIAPMAHGSDGGGSIRIPAGWCGLVGLNPSRGRVSGGPNNQDRSFGLPRDFVLCRTVRDMAAALDVFAGPHPGDPFIIVQPHRTYVEELSRPTGALRVGLAITDWGTISTDPEIRQAVENTATLLEEMGHVVTEISPPFEFGEYCRSLLPIRILGRRLSADSLENDARAQGRRIDSNTLEPLSLKLYEYGKSQSASVGDVLEALRGIRFRVGEAIHPFDVLLTPTMPTVALAHCSIYSTTNPALSAEEYLEADASLYQYLGVFNVTGHPSVSLPLAQSRGGLPIGVQIVSRFGDEATLVRIARDLEEARPWHDRRPPVRAGAV
ncbi:amidase [Bradyrhizobium sp. WU425]|uniref:amidase n=1 Tax=Bradyrhizobium sp. WU425 TaxID=187029 RepID=UPI001E41287A|nr:amidase [Bradyrhizobium canariense]UFW71401.1 amidase [Bradyrhizobium canariense]